MNIPDLSSWLLAQAIPNAPVPSAATESAEFVDITALVLKRWYGSVTLASPWTSPSGWTIAAWLLGMAALLFLVVLIQGPRKALGQLLDVPGHIRLLAAAIGRLKRSTRLVAILLSVTVLSWTAWQTPLHDRPAKKEELTLLLKGRDRGELALEQGFLAALTPYRDLMALGDSIVLLVAAGVLIFKSSADRWGRYQGASERSTGGLTTICWGGAGLYAMYRIADLLRFNEGLPPLGGCLVPEIGFIPLLMLLADGLMLAWVLVELKSGGDRDETPGFDVAGTVALAPASMLACLVGLPARYAATGLGLAVFYEYLPIELVKSRWVSVFLRGGGLIALQAAATLTVGLVGAVAWGRGSCGGSMRGYGRMLREEGGRLVGLTAIVGAGVAGSSALVYFAVLAMPAQPWVLLVADGYAHYASLPIGLVGLAGLVELGGRVAVPVKAPEPDLGEPGIILE